MNESRQAWKVGLFVFVCLALLGALLLNFSKGLSLLKPTYELRLRTANVGGIKPQAAVLMAGVQVGAVASVTLDPGGKSATLRLRIDARYVIHQDARFVIEQSGFLGDQYVSVLPDQNAKPPLANGAEVSCEEPFNLQEAARAAAGFLQRVDETARRLNDAIARVDRLVLSEETLTNLAVTAGNFRRVSDRALGTMDRVDALVDSNRLPVSLSVSNFLQVSERIGALTADLQSVVASNRDEVTRTLKNVESASVLVNSVLADLQAGNGLAGTVLKDPQSARDFQAMVANLKELGSNLNVTALNINTRGLWWLLWKPKPGRTNLPFRSDPPGRAVAPKGRP